MKPIELNPHPHEVIEQSDELRHQRLAAERQAQRQAGEGASPSDCTGEQPSKQPVRCSDWLGDDLLAIMDKTNRTIVITRTNCANKIWNLQSDAGSLAALSFRDLLEGVAKSQHLIYVKADENGSGESRQSSRTVQFPQSGESRPEGFSEFLRMLESCPARVAEARASLRENYPILEATLERWQQLGRPHVEAWPSHFGVEDLEEHLREQRVECCLS